MSLQKIASTHQSCLFLFKFSIIVIIVFYFLNILQVHGQCPNNEACSDVCAVQGNGTCLPKRFGKGQYCSCDGCPTRSLEELTNPHLCTLDPICQLNCPAPNVSTGRTYWGHTCLSGIKPVCICYCLPITPQSIIDTIKCPFRSQQQKSFSKSR